MVRTEFEAIQYPEQWPPPDMPAIPPHPLSWIPIIGHAFQHCRWLWYSRAHRKGVLNRIADKINIQLEARPEEGPWPTVTVPKRRELAQIISEAVCLEKGLTHPPALHPNDPYPLLIWGPFDDLTPLIVGMESRKQLKLEIPSDTSIDAWNQRWTVQQFIEQLLPEPEG